MLKVTVHFYYLVYMSLLASCLNQKSACALSVMSSDSRVRCFFGDNQQYEELSAKRILFALIKLAVMIGRASTQIHKI
jgi:hypothetical protein